jgi:hypothetical protein
MNTHQIHLRSRLLLPALGALVCLGTALLSAPPAHAANTKEQERKQAKQCNDAYDRAVNRCLSMTSLPQAQREGCVAVIYDDLYLCMKEKGLLRLLPKPPVKSAVKPLQEKAPPASPTTAPPRDSLSTAREKQKTSKAALTPAERVVAEADMKERKRKSWAPAAPRQTGSYLP